MDDSSTPRLEALATLRLVLPSVLLGVLLIRFAVKAFLGLMTRIQAQGWVQLEDEVVPGSGAGAGEEEQEDAILPVVVRVRRVRRGIVLNCFAFVAATYFAEGVAQVIATLILSTFTPDLPLFRNMIPYVLGGLSAFSLCAIAMCYEERLAGKEGSWGAIYPRLLPFLALGFEVAIAVLLALSIKAEPTNQPSATPLPAIHLGLLSTRLLLLSLLLLSQIPPFYTSSYIPNPSLSHPSERTSLLGSTTSYGTAAPPFKANPLRSSRPPSNRPPDPSSLSLLTLFTRVRTLFPYLWPSKSFSLQILAMVCVGLMLVKRFVNVFVPLFFGRVVGDLSGGRPPYVNIGLYVLASFLQDSNTMLYRYLWLPIEQYSEREMMVLSFDCLLNLAYHTRRKTGELLRILSRADAINNFFETLLFTFLPILIDLPVAVVVLSVKYGAVIVSVVMGVSVIFVTTSVTLAESRTKLYRKLRDENQFMSQIKTDTLLNWETVKIFTAEHFESERLRNAMRVYQKGYFKVYSAWNSLSLIQDSISAFGLLVCSFILAKRVIDGTMDVGDYVTFVAYLGQLYGPLNKIAGLYRTVMSNLVDTEQLMDLLNEEKDVVDRPGAVDLVVGNGGIEFKDVKFSYDGKKDTIRGISFVVPAGASVALVGSSGGGKSTIMRLLYRFYDVSEGSITIDGVDVRDLTQLSLRKAIGLVPQDSVLFNETLRFNLAYGNHEATEEDMVEATRKAAMHDRILSFPDKYETRVGERGQRLSGGEKQRVAIARVILKNPPILLLDEATSALDTTNERAIQQRLREVSKGRTTLAIAHRLSTIVDCDTIYVLDEGVIAESGSHAELLAKGGIYAELWLKQIQEQPAMDDTASGTASGAVTPKSE